MPQINAWSLGILLVAILISVPVMVVLSSLFFSYGSVWVHLTETVLFEYSLHSLLLMLGVGCGSLLLGCGCAWIIAFYRFPGCTFFQWALTLPLAMPAYIIAYTYSGILDFFGPVQSVLREWMGWGYGDYWFPEIHSLTGAAIMLSLVLYPYIYLLVRSAFLEQSTAVREACRILGVGRWKSFFLVTLPMVRPAIIAGLSLVLMETLADYGTVKYFGVTTMTTGIFRTWFGLGDTVAAAQLSALLLLVVWFLLVIEGRSRLKVRYYGEGLMTGNSVPVQLSGWRAITAFIMCCFPLVFGFLIPASQLVFWAWKTAPTMVNREFITLLFNSFGLAVLTAFLALLFALFMTYGKRLYPKPVVIMLVRLAAMGYAIPGAVIAVGLMLPFGWLDNSLDQWMSHYWGVSTGLLLSGTLFILVFAYLVRFLAVAINTCDAGLGTISPQIDDAARSLGHRPATILRRIHIPLMARTLFACLLLVFVDVLKELPATLVLRPFNFNTLAVRAFELASDERLADSSTAALAIVLVGLVPVIFLNKVISSNSEKS